MMYGLCDFTQMCIEYIIFVLGYDDKDNNLPSVMVSTLSSQSSGLGLKPNVRRMICFIFVIHSRYSFEHSLKINEIKTHTLSLK